MSLASASDLAAFRPNDEIDPDDPAVILSLDAASAAIERYCNRTFAQTSETVTLLETTDYTFTTNGELHRITWLWYSWLTYEIDYTHGFEPVPADVQMACIRIASGYLDTSGSSTGEVQKIQLGSFAETYASSLATNLAQGESSTLDLYRLVDVH